MTERMRATARHQYTWYLEPAAQFTWTKSGAQGGNDFTVETVGLELFEGMPDRAPCIHLTGPWLNGYRTQGRDGDDALNGWQFLYANTTDADRIRELPLETREALAERDALNGWQFLYANTTDADRIRELPLETREALAERGLTIPL